nr:hypothetical protein [Tanacetum cinerariifolium]
MRTRSRSRNNSPQREASPAIVEPLRIELPFLEDQFQEDPPPEVPMLIIELWGKCSRHPPRVTRTQSACPHHGFSELHQLDTFYNALNVNDQDSLNSAAGGNFLDKMLADYLKIIESKSKVRQTRAKAVVAKEDPPPEVSMADNRTMAELLQAPTEGYEDAIVIPEITANNFELKHGLINLDDLVSKFINQFFPPSKTINLRNEITRFQQRFDESFYEAWERFNDLLRECPHHGFSELHQLDTFYNALNVNDQDSLNSAAGGNFLDKIHRECLKIIESKSKVRQSRAKAVVAKVSTSSSTPAISSDVAELKDMVKALLLDKKNQSLAPTPSSTPAPVKAVEPNCVTCGGVHSYQNCPANNKNAYRDNIQEYVSQAAVANYNQGNTGFRPQMVANQIRPSGFPPHQNNQNNFNKGNNFNQNRGGNFNQSNFNPSSFNQGQLHRPQINQPLVYQALVYQDPIPQTQRVSQTDFESYVKANDAILSNMQSQGQRTLLGNIITNPKKELKGITTRSGVAYQGPKTPSPSKQVTEVTKDQV